MSNRALDERDLLATSKYLQRILGYDPETGVFIWREQTAQSTKIGSVAGNLNKLGYIRIRFLKRGWMAHRLAWRIVHGVWPANQLDHINGVKSDNRLVNLREATDSENQRNTPLDVTNTSGFKGIVWHKRNKKWMASCRVNRKKVHLGYFLTPEAASTAYLEFARHNHGEFFNPGSFNQNLVEEGTWKIL